MLVDWPEGRNSSWVVAVLPLTPEKSMPHVLMKYRGEREFATALKKIYRLLLIGTIKFIHIFLLAQFPVCFVFRLWY